MADVVNRTTSGRNTRGMNAPKCFAALLSLLVVACDDGPGLEADPMCEAGPAVGKADDGSEQGLEEDVVMLTRRLETGAEQVVVLEGTDALAFEELALNPDVEEGDVDAFLEVIGRSPEGGVESEFDEDSAEHRSLGVCIPLVNRHVRQMHVGWTDERLIQRAPSLPTHRASAWDTEASAYSAIEAVLSQTCQEILAWQATAPLQGHIKQAAYTGVPGRVCSWDGQCVDGYAAEIIYKKTAAFGGWHAGKITTAYPVPF